MVLHGLSTWSSSDDRPARPLASGSLVVSSFSGGAHVLMYLKLREDVSSFTSQSWSCITSDSFHAQLGYLPLTWVFICMFTYVCIYVYVHMYVYEHICICILKNKTKKNKTKKTERVQSVQLGYLSLTRVCARMYVLHVWYEWVYQSS